MTEASRSVAEWTASEITAAEPLIAPNDQLQHHQGAVRSNRE